MKIIQSPTFMKTVKKLNKKEKTILDTQVIKIINNPNIGIQKRGNLQDVFIHKFKINSLQFLLAYRKNTDLIELIMLGTHENYYRDLHNYIN